MFESRNRLCVEVVRERFGDDHARVFQTLVTSGPRLTLSVMRKLVDSSKMKRKSEMTEAGIDAAKLSDPDSMSLDQVCTCLRTLIHHNLVRFHVYTSGKVPIVKYSADLDTCEMLLNGVLYLSHLKQFAEKSADNPDVECAHYLIEFLLTHGRLTLTRLYESFEERCLQLRSEIVKKYPSDFLKVYTSSNATGRNPSESAMDTDETQSNPTKQSDLFFGTVLSMARSSGMSLTEIDSFENSYPAFIRAISGLSNEPLKRDDDEMDTDEDGLGMVSTYIRGRFGSIWKWLVNERCFVKEYPSVEELPPELGDTVVKYASDSAAEERTELLNQFVINHRTFLFEMRNCLLSEYASEHYGLVGQQIVNCILAKSMRNACLDFSSDHGVYLSQPMELSVEFCADSEKSDERSEKRDQLISNRHSIGELDFVADDVDFGRVPLDHLMKQVDCSAMIKDASSGDARWFLESMVTDMSDDSRMFGEIRHMCPILRCNGLSSDRTVSVNIIEIMERVRMKQIKSLIMTRFSEANTVRVFSAVCDLKFASAKQLSELCLMNGTDVRKCLYDLSKDGLVQTHCITQGRATNVNAVDRDPKKMIYAWRVVNSSVLRQRMLHSLYQSWTNLLMKKRSIMKSLQSTLTESDQKRALNRAVDQLNVGLFHITQQICLQRDY